MYNTNETLCDNNKAPKGGMKTSKKYSLISNQTLNQKENTIWNIVNNGRLPNYGLNEISVMNILHQISSQNLCNSEKNVKIGERENRIYSSIVRSKYIGFGHGIGRSGNLEDVQPKSAGNSILAKLTTSFVKDLIRNFGIKSCEDVYILPYATGMCLSTCLLYLKQIREDSQYVIISRIDHKTCYKCISFCNLKYFVVDMIYKNEELYTDLEGIEKLLEEYKEKICCVMSTTSVYAPRNSDDIIKIAHICKKYNTPHIINNAFGLQCTYICKEIQKCFESQGRVDFVVQSCDKNFLVPVNGGIIFSSNREQMKLLKKSYPGRTPVNAYLDLFITLLEMGKDKIMNLRKERVDNFNWLKEKIQLLCLKYNLELIRTSKNFISMAINLNHMYTYCNTDNPKVINMLGSMLFYRNVTGHRVICSPLLNRNYLLKKAREKYMNILENKKGNDAMMITSNESNEENVKRDLSKKETDIYDNMYSYDFDESKSIENDMLQNKSNIIKAYEKQIEEEFDKLNEPNTIVIGNHKFKNFGSSYNSYPISYIAFSCVVGIEKPELENFVSKLDNAIDYFIKFFKKKKKEEELK